MRSKIYMGVVCAWGLCVLGGTASAAVFEPLFQIRNIEGKCLVQTPSASKMVKAENNRAYPYGTTIKTDKRGSVVIILSEGNTCTLGALTDVRLDESKIDKKNKVLVIDGGMVDIVLDSEFHKANGFDVITPVASCKAIGCKFSVETLSETEVDITTFTCTDGTVSASGPDFAIPELNRDDVLSVTTAKDNSFSRIETVKGEIGIEIRDSEGQPKIKKTKEGSLIKIWRTVSESGTKRIVTLLVTTPDGTLEEAITYTEDQPQADMQVSAVAAAAPAVIAEAKPEPKAVAKEVPDQVAPTTDGDVYDPPMQLAEDTDGEVPSVGSGRTLGLPVTLRPAAAPAGTAVVIAPAPRRRPPATPTYVGEL